MVGGLLVCSPSTPFPSCRDRSSRLESYTDRSRQSAGLCQQAPYSKHHAALSSYSPFYYHPVSFFFVTQQRSDWNWLTTALLLPDGSEPVVKNRKKSRITPTPRGMGLSAPRSGDGRAAQGSPNHSGTTPCTTPPLLRKQITVIGSH